MARALGGQGHEVRLLACAVSPPPADPGPNVLALPVAASNLAERRLGFPWPAPGPAGFRAIAGAVEQSDVVVIHDALYATSVIATMTARRAGRPTLVVQHIGEVPYRSPVLRWTMRAANAVVGRPLLSRADQVVFISRTTAEHFSSVRFRRPPELIFNGVDTAFFRPAASRSAKLELRRAFGLREDQRIALFVGRFVEKKGLDVMSALAAARPHDHFAFAGWGPKDPAGWNAPNVTVFRGLAGPALADLYRACDALVLPSVGEGFPLVIQEAMACGLPVVCGAETARADDAAAGLLRGVDLSGPPAAAANRVAAALDAAIEDGPEASAALAAFAAARYAWSVTAARYIEVLGRLEGRRTGP
jgi:glycosyltransferase involved in cell wall biosynthesis